jgi:hypothetical protein
MRRQFENAGLPLDRFGWASVQLDGGIEKTLGKIEAWFDRATATLMPAVRVPASLGALRLGLFSSGRVSASASAVLARVACEILEKGGSILVPESDSLLADPNFRATVLGSTAPRATLAYGQPITEEGLHVVATETDHWVENLAGLGGCGAHVFVGLVGDMPQQGHPMLPVLQVAEAGVLDEKAIGDVDVVLTGDAETDVAAVLRQLSATVSGKLIPSAATGGFVDFQLSRGLLGVST